MIYRITMDVLGESVLIKNSLMSVIIDGEKALSLDEAFVDEDAKYYGFAREGAVGIMRDNNDPIILNGIKYDYIEVLSKFDESEYEREIAGTIDEEMTNLHQFVTDMEVSSIAEPFDLFGWDVSVVKIADSL